MSMMEILQITMSGAKHVFSFLIQPLHPSRMKYFSRLMSTDTSIISLVSDFVRNAEEKSVNPSILRQQLPDILLSLTKVKSKESGPMVDYLLDKLKLAGVEFSTRIHRTVGC